MWNVKYKWLAKTINTIWFIYFLPSLITEKIIDFTICFIKYYKWKNMDIVDKSTMEWAKESYFTKKKEIVTNHRWIFYLFTTIISGFWWWIIYICFIK